MNTLLRKEFRLLMPARIAALVAATMPLWSRWEGDDFQGLWLPCFGSAALFLALMPFGQEMSCGTFSLLLSQPEKRARIWRIKAGLLALALLSAWVLFTGCCWIGRSHLDRWQFIEFASIGDMAGASGLLTLLAFSGGLWTTLLLRDMTAAVFATVLAPLIIFGAADATAAVLLGDHEEVKRVVYLALSVYVVAGYFVARRLFLMAEDVPRVWTGGQLSLPKARLFPFRWAGFGFQQKRRPWSALICKELQLQEITIILVPLLALLHLALLAVRHFAPQWSARMLVFEYPVFVLWMLASFVVGCVAVAEERGYNTLESVLCLPVRKRSQFAVKFAVVMGLGTVLGGVIPWVLEYFGGGNTSSTHLEPLLWFLSVAASVTAIAFFASTMSRGMLQAFAVAVLCAFLLLFSFLSYMNFVSLQMRSGSVFGWVDIQLDYSLFEFLIWPAMIAAYFMLAYRNYKSLQTGPRLWAANLAWLAAVVAVVFFVSCASSGLLKMYLHF